MTTLPNHPAAPAAWRDSLARSEAQLAEGLIVPGAEVMRELHDAIARLEAKSAAAQDRKAAPHR